MKVNDILFLYSSAASECPLGTAVIFDSTDNQNVVFFGETLAAGVTNPITFTVDEWPVGCLHEIDSNIINPRQYFSNIKNLHYFPYI